jgi:hypothetical protein
MNELSLAIHLLFVIDRIEPPWLVVEWSPSGEIAELPQPLLPKSAQEGEQWAIRIESKHPCTNGVAFNTQLNDTTGMLFELPSAITLPAANPYCIQIEGPL